MGIVRRRGRRSRPKGSWRSSPDAMPAILLHQDLRATPRVIGAQALGPNHLSACVLTVVEFHFGWKQAGRRASKGVEAKEAEAMAIASASDRFGPKNRKAWLSSAPSEQEPCRAKAPAARHPRYCHSARHRGSAASHSFGRGSRRGADLRQQSIAYPLRIRRHIGLRPVFSSLPFLRWPLSEASPLVSSLPLSSSGISSSTIDVGIDALGLDRTAGRRVIARRRQAQRAVVCAERDDRLHRALAEGARAEMVARL